MDANEKLILEIKTTQATHYEALKDRERIKRLHQQITIELEEKDTEVRNLSNQLDRLQSFLLQQNLD
jgi:hypothetical protein